MYRVIGETSLGREHLSSNVNDMEKEAMQRRRGQKDEAEGTVRTALRGSQDRHVAGTGRGRNWDGVPPEGQPLLTVLVDFGKDSGF